MLPLMTAFLLTLSMYGCGEDSIHPGTVPAGQGHPENPATRVSLGVRAGATATADLATSASVGFFMKDPANPAVFQYANIKGGYDATDNLWKPTAGNIWIDNRMSDLGVYAPHNPATSYNTGNLPLSSAIHAADGSNDLLAARFTTNNAGIVAGLDVTLSHVYTRLVFTFVKNSGYTDALVLNKLELGGKDIFSAGSYDLFADTYAAGTGEPKKITVAVNLTVPATAVPTPETARADLLLVPVHRSFTDDALLEVHATDGKHMKVPIPKATFTDARPFAPGKQYNFTVKLSPAEMEIIDVKVNEWEDGADVSEEVKFDN